MAAAGLWSTPTDIAKFGIDLLKGLCGCDSQLLQQAAIREMLEPQLAHEAEAQRYAGLGFFCERNGDVIRFSHGGWDEGFVCEMCLVASCGKGAVVMINSNEGHPILNEVLRSIAKEYDWPSEPDKNSILALADPERYRGRYRSASGQDFDIVVIDSGWYTN